MLVKSIVKLSNDECYPQWILDEFKNYKLGSLDNVNHTYDFIKDVIADFNGNAEKFYPKFYKNITGENTFLNLSKQCSTLLGMEVANHVLAFLTDSNFSDDNFDSNLRSVELNSKEKSIVCYIGGYVFGTLYKRLRFSKRKTSTANQDFLSILLAGKLSDTQTLLEDEHKLVNSKNRGGLWKITKPAINIFTITELKFRQSVNKSGRKIDSVALTSSLVKDCGVLSNYDKIRSNAEQKISKEIALNFLEHLLMLFIRVRAFSYVRNIQQLHKMKSNKKKASSLRKEIKKASSSLDKGH